MEVGEEQVGPGSIERIADKALQCRLIRAIRIAPARLLLPLANRFDHVRLKPLGEFSHSVAIIWSQARRPGTEECLVNEIFDVAVGYDLVVDLAPVRAIEAQPPHQAPTPLSRHLRKERQ